MVPLISCCATEHRASSAGGDGHDKGEDNTASHAVQQNVHMCVELCTGLYDALRVSAVWGDSESAPNNLHVCVQARGMQTLRCRSACGCKLPTALKQWAARMGPGLPAMWVGGHPKGAEPPRQRARWAASSVHQTCALRTQFSLKTLW